MTSFLSTGGIRGGGNSVKGYEARSFNMGLSKAAFLESGGFGNIHPGEDPDLSIRLKSQGFRIKLIPGAYVYHKRRISFQAFYRQVSKFGKVRPILNLWHPQSRKISYWLPSLFLMGILFALLILFAGTTVLHFVPLFILLTYLMVVLVDAWIRTTSLKVAAMSVFAVVIQLFAYGSGFLESTILVTFSGKNPRDVYPELFY
jgi:GT2 family glycosyltransferase